MDSAQGDFRELYASLIEYDGGSPYRDVLAPWVEANTDELDWLRSFASRSRTPVPVAEPEDLRGLYALGRVNEILLLRFQRGQADGIDWPGPAVSLDEYVAFAESLGLAANAVPQPFSPFYHEIVEVHQADDEERPVSLLATFWPCLMLGEMLFSRAGVRVLGGRRFIRKEVAESSTLYWAYRRKNRPYHDLSRGWGSNSQWGTKFRRDYRIGQGFHYNVDGTHDLAVLEPTAEDWYGLGREERIELLTNRCFVTTIKPHSDLYPYNDVFRTEAVTERTHNVTDCSGHTG
jgi:hypothetical protein